MNRITTEIINPETDHLTTVGVQEFHDLMLMLDNWGSGYLRLAAEGVDWSLPHEYFEDFTDQMVPYIMRLKVEGYATPERLRAIGDKILDNMNVLITFMQTEEDVLRLGGKWSDKDQEIKEYWEREGGSNAYLRVRMSTVQQLEG